MDATRLIHASLMAATLWFAGGCGGQSVSSRPLETYSHEKRSEAIALAESYLQDALWDWRQLGEILGREYVEEEWKFLKPYLYFKRNCRFDFNIWSRGELGDRYRYSVDIRIKLKDQPSTDVSNLAVTTIPLLTIPKDYEFEDRRIRGREHHRVVRLQSKLISIMRQVRKPCIDG